MENSYDEIAENLSKIVPAELVSKIQHLSSSEFQSVLTLLRQKQGENVSFPCGICEKTFKNRKSLLQHRKSHTDNFTCDICGVNINRKDNFHRHMRLQHGQVKRKERADERDKEGSRKKTRTSNEGTISDGTTDDHGEERIRKKTRKENISNEGATPGGSSTTGADKGHSDDANLINTPRRTTAINGSVEKFEIIPSSPDEKYDLILFIKEKKEEIKQILEDKCVETNIKFFMVANIRMIKYAPDGTYEEARPCFRSVTKTVIRSQENIDHDLNESFQKIFTAMEEFIKNGSGWHLEEVLKLEVTITKFKPLGGGSYIDLPLSLKRTNSLLNVVNKDDRCLVWAVLSSIHHREEDINPEQVENYFPFFNTLDVTNIDFPTPLSHIARFECQNNVSINVFGFESGEIFPLFITKKTYCHHVNLLYLRDGEKAHYVWIKNLNRFLSRCSKRNGEYFYCHLCLQKFTSEGKMIEHQRDCQNFKFQKISLPKEGEVLEFKEYAKTTRVPFVIYCDFETFTRKIDTCEPNPDLSSTTAYQQMDPYSYGYQRVSIDKRYDKPPVIYRGPNVVDHFIKTLLEEEKEIKSILSRIEPMIVNDFVKLEYKEAKLCYVCKKPFSKNNHKVIDHDHVTGDVRGIACNNCNLQMKTPNFIPVVCHNLKGFDAALIMSEIGKYKEYDIKIIPQNSQKYLSFSLSNLRFIDSLQFLDSSLETLTKNLAEEGEEHFEYLSRSFPDPDTFSLLLRKGVFPYDYVDGEDKLKDTVLPHKKDFFSRLTQQDISDEDYAFAEDVWEKLKIKNLGEYSDVYLKTDVTLLTDIFERFRSLCLLDYGLDPCHYFTSPGLSWSAMLRKTGVVLDLIHDVDMLLFLEKGIRGGVSSIFHRYAKANNPYLDDSYDPTRTTSYLSYLDANNLYGWAMSEPLPYANFVWLNDSEIENLDINSISAHSKEGYIFEVDLEYPESLHNSHNDFPLAPESKTIETKDLSPYCFNVMKNVLGRKRLTKCEKLIPNLYDKDRYVVHYRNLQLYLDLGMKVKKVHRVVKFHQRCWLKEYIDFNTEKRKHATNEFQKSLYKLLNNSIFGRSLMNTRKHVDIKLCHTEQKVFKYTSKPSYKSCTIFNQDLVAVENKRVNILINQPIYIGFCILDLAKHLMYDFHYNHMKKIYNDKIRVCFSDTDSFLYYIETEDVYEDMKEHKHIFDTSDYPKKHMLFGTHNKKVLGKFKDESKSIPISEFIGLRSKMYSYKTEQEEKHTAKGITKSSSKKLKHHMYKDCLFNKKIERCQMNVIRNSNHILQSQIITKKSLVPFDDKRWILDDGITTRAYGHKDNKKKL